MPQSTKDSKPPYYDVIVVYDAQNAQRANDDQYRERTPFASGSSYANYNECYEYFLQCCRAFGLTAAFSTTDDVMPDGSFASVWLHDGTWQRVTKPSRTALVFDKFSPLIPRNKAAATSLARASVRLVHNPEIRKLFDDKQTSYTALAAIAIPTVSVNLDSTKTITNAIGRLELQESVHQHIDDFSDRVVLKDRFGFGGERVYKYTGQASTWSLPRAEGISYILQPFIEATDVRNGATGGVTDLRVIIFQGRIVQCYVRIAKEGDFRANAQQGGRIVYLGLKQIPADVIDMAESIESQLPEQDALYSLDFLKSRRGNLYFVEGNSTPGLNWFGHEDERHAKELIGLLVGRVKSLVSPAVRHPR